MTINITKAQSAPGSPIVSAMVMDNDTVTVTTYYTQLANGLVIDAMPEAWRIKEAISAAIRDDINERPGHYVRFTRNRDEIKMIKAGTLRNSRNIRDGYSEAGLSVTDDYHYSMTGLPYCYELDGTVIGSGADGEPLIDLGSVTWTSEMHKWETYSVKVLARRQAIREEWCKRRNWTPEAMMDCLTGRVQF